MCGFHERDPETVPLPPAGRGPSPRRGSRSGGAARALLLGVAAAAPAVACAESEARSTPEHLTVRVVRSYAHDPAAFTQGLELAGGKLYESTGLAGRSSLRRVDLATGTVERRVDLPAPLFVEGLTRVGARLYQLTWQDGRAFVYDLDTFDKLRELRYEGEGWGLCYDGRRLVMSNGSDRLALRDPETFAKRGELAVRLRGSPVGQLNELECAGGAIYANVWQTRQIVRIDAKTGAVTAVVDVPELLTPEERRFTDVLNGIAHVPGSSRFLITGKLWPRLFEVELVRKETPP
jgi:glutaminyl-peptide cyclotransferase